MNPFATLVAQVTKTKPKKEAPLVFEITTTFRPRATAAKALRALIENGGVMTASDLSARTGIPRNSLRSALASSETAGIVSKELQEGRTVYRMIK